MASREVTIFQLFPCRLQFRTNLYVLIAAGIEATSLRWIDGAGNIALENDPLPFLVNLGQWDGRKKRNGIWMLRVAKYLVTWCKLHDCPQVHDRDSIADMLHHTEVMGNEEI